MGKAKRAPWAYLLVLVDFSDDCGDLPSLAEVDQVLVDDGVGVTVLNERQIRQEHAWGEGGGSKTKEIYEKK